MASGGHRYFGYLPQDVELFAGTVAENISRLSEANSADIIAAASDFASATEPRTGPADLRDVLFAARCIVDRPPGAMPEPHLFLSAPFQRLSFDPAACDEILHASATEVASLRAALID